eukprot:TRINITY_DN7997_c0_g1_i1.p1 TRINITY_DN7997_c0_g1~~TRINITY_DN7997_c0_g1_i1.p1  ORF type:complete len:504 (+),score=110.22 TRINITY_DN7997_c0_g1_i1:74-1513(+)
MGDLLILPSRRPAARRPYIRAARERAELRARLLLLAAQRRCCSGRGWRPTGSAVQSRPASGARALPAIRADEWRVRVSELENKKQVRHWTVRAMGYALVTTGLVMMSLMREYSVFPVDQDKLVADITYLLEQDPSLAPLFIRLVFNQAAPHTYRHASNSSSANTASLRFPGESERRENKGLDRAVKVLAVVKEVHYLVPLADIWTLAGSVAIEHLGGPTVVPLWHFGRIDCQSDLQVAPIGMVPDPRLAGEQGCLRILGEFLRMGFTIRQCVALMGAHTVGRCHPEYSGYSGQWTSNPARFDNEYYRNLMEHDWLLTQPTAPDRYPQYAACTAPAEGGFLGFGKARIGGNDPLPGELRMLPSDLALLFNERTKAIVAEYAADEQQWRSDFADAWTKLCDLNMHDIVRDPLRDRETPYFPMLSPSYLWSCIRGVGGVVASPRETYRRVASPVDSLRERFEPPPDEAYYVRSALTGRAAES